MPANRIVIRHNATVTRARREEADGHRGAVVWFTGLSGSGKSTLAHTVEEHLFQMGCKTFTFDGDNVRHGLCADLDFSLDARHENIRRIGEMVNLFLEAGLIALTAFISPLKADRERVSRLVGRENFIEIFCQCPLEVCEQRDVKGLYAKARAGEIPDFTGISSPYEAPEAADLALDTSTTSLAQCADRILDLLFDRGVLSNAMLERRKAL